MKKSVALLIFMLSLLFVVGAFAETTKWTYTGNWDKFTLYYGIGDEEPVTLDFLPAVITFDGNNFSAPGPTDLVVGETYKVTLTAWFNDEEGAHSSPDFIYVKVLNVPSNVLFTDGVLSWIAPEGEFDGYLITYTIGEETSTMDVAADQLQATITIPCGSDYTITIASTRNDVLSDPSALITGYTSPCPPTNVRWVLEE